MLAKILFIYYNTGAVIPSGSEESYAGVDLRKISPFGRNDKIVTHIKERIKKMGKKRFGSLLCLVVFVFCMLACDKFQGEKTGSQTVDGDLVVAKIGNTKITVKEFERKYNTVPPQYKMLFSGEEGKRKFLDEVVKEKILAEKARSVGIDKKADVKEVIDDIRDNILAKEMFTAKNEELTKSVTVTEEEIEKEIKESGTLACASHILLKDETKAKDILKRARKGGDFTKLAVEFSEDPSVKRNNGELGTFSKGDMLPEFDNAVFALKIGEISSELAKTSYGYHIIKRTEPEKEEVKNRLISRKQNDSINNWMEEIKKEISVEINEDILKKINFEKEDQGKNPHGGMQGGMQGGMPAGHGGM
ncbi:MAG: peptidylprolyl isomerase [bacterium]